MKMIQILGLKWSIKHTNVSPWSWIKYEMRGAMKCAETLMLKYVT